jgi:hypothetical protein
MVAVSERAVDPVEPDMIAAVDAIGVDREQDFHAVPGPFGYLGGGDSRVKPQRDASVAQVVRSAGQR